ncbi:MAG: DUF1501 domain-containing protein, partial [Planctomycetaceae bacterium]|nr:DUF1501 domain-containing protein [Planctomycetaceae bacterium]
MKISRRQLLRQCSAGFGSVALASMLVDEARAAGLQGSETSAYLPHFPAKAKRVIFLFMKGGPSHMDTFDYKPQLQNDDNKQLPFDKPRVQFAPTGELLASPWKFKRHGDSGIAVSELFPYVAQCVDDLCIINS